MQEPKALPLFIRALAGVGVGMLGFAFPLFFFIGVFILWTVFMDLTDPGKSSSHEDDLTPQSGIDFGICPVESATADDPEWKSVFLLSCESPAESAFLEAAIQDMALLPEKGVLRSSEFSLKMQVDFKIYRVDFMLNDRLIIEIDGEAYHSSSEDQVYDQQRDAYFESIGYTTLRLPAKDVFTKPIEVMKRVRAAWSTVLPHKALESPTTPIVASPEPFNVFKSLKKFDAVLSEGSRRMSQWAKEEEERKEQNSADALARIQAEAAEELRVEMAIYEVTKSDKEFGRELDRRIKARQESAREEEATRRQRELESVRAQNRGRLPAPAEFYLRPYKSPFDHEEESDFRLEEAQILLLEWPAIRTQREA